MGKESHLFRPVPLLTSGYSSLTLYSVVVFLGHMSRCLPHPEVFGKPLRSSRSPVAQISSPILVSALGKGLGSGGPRVLMAHVLLQPCKVPSVPRLLPDVSLTYKHPEVSSVAASSIPGQHLSAWGDTTDAHAVGGGRHVLADKSSGVPMALEDLGSCKVSAQQKAFLGINEMRCCPACIHSASNPSCIEQETL